MRTHLLLSFSNTFLGLCLVAMSTSTLAVPAPAEISDPAALTVATTIPAAATDTSAATSVMLQAAQASEKQQDIFGCRWENNEFEVGLKNRDEIYYSHSTALLSPAALDQILWAQSIWDLKTKAKIADGALSSNVTIRNKYRWGSPESIASTSETPIKIGDTTIGNHLHYLFP